MSTPVRAAVWSDDCPQCKKTNYFDEGSKYDVEALTCWSCKHKWLLEMCEEWTTLDDAYDVDGRKRP